MGQLRLVVCVWPFGAEFLPQRLVSMRPHDNPIGLLMMLYQDWVGMALRVVVLFFFIRGFQACRKLKATA